MAEVTKRKIASIYSMIVGFVLSLFSGKVHAGQMFFRSGQLDTTRIYTPQSKQLGTDTVSAGRNVAPTPSTLAVENNLTPTVDTVSAGRNVINAINTTSFTPSMTNVETISDINAREYVSSKAQAEGLDTKNLSSEFVNTAMIEYLMKEVDSLKAQLQTKQQ